MEEKTFNEDYINGIKFLLKESKEEGVNIRKSQWIPHVSKMLSEHNLCYKFWYNVWKQNKLHNIPLCGTWYDIMYEPSRYLFRWRETREGFSFWASMLSEVLGEKVSVSMLRRPLRD